ncbi:MAG TPA: hypothetical protein VH208_11805, partial [Myxococcaceae bacterium]|nr:hypothetical protein [Myxococcaceae bacterium]
MRKSWGSPRKPLRGIVLAGKLLCLPVPLASMVPWQAIVPGATDRATFLGQTGSGKTFLAEQLVRTRGFVVVHDGKGRIEWPGF